MSPTMDFTADLIPRLDVGPHARAERVVHSLDGLRVPVRADDLLSIGGRLWAKARAELPDLRDIDYVLGLDAGGILPTVALAMAADLPYKIAWKLRLPLPGMIRFTEPHANRPDVYAYGIAAGQRVLIVDDEVTTGETLRGLVEQLRVAGAVPLGAVCLVEDRGHGSRELLDGHGIPLVALTSLGGRT